ISTKVGWDENFTSAPNGVRSVFVLDPVMDNDQRPLVGLGGPFLPPYVDGPVSAHITYTVKRDHAATLEMSADMSGAAMAVPDIGWHKAAGEPATGILTATLANDRLVTVPSFHVIGEGLDLAGAVTFADQSALKSLTMTAATIGETKFAGSLARDAAGGYA